MLLVANCIVVVVVKLFCVRRGLLFLAKPVGENGAAKKKRKPKPQLSEEAKRARPGEQRGRVKLVFRSNSFELFPFANPSTCLSSSQCMCICARNVWG